MWTRLLTTPLTYLPFWNRSWKQGISVAAWFAVNPFIFPEPENDEAWAVKAIHGEAQWLRDRPMDASMLIQAKATVLGAGGLYAASKQKLVPTIGSAVGVMALQLWYLDRMTMYYEE